MPLTAGKKLGPYEILSARGTGGMGEVYRARDTRLDRVVAVKILRTDLSVNDDRRRRFEREARAVSSLNHPHICTLYDIGHEDGVDFIVMQYLEGETLAERLKRGALPAKEAVRVAIEITEALESAHQQGIVHRDLKPANVMLTKLGAMLMDFGLARLRVDKSAVEIGDGSATLEQSAEEQLTANGRIIGTMRYMAPEQIEGREVDARTDIFAAGVLLYEMLTGRQAFEGSTSAEIIAATLKTEPPPISNIASDPSGSLDRIIRSCIEKKTEHRWQSAHDLTLALKLASGTSGATAAAGPTSIPLLRRPWVGWSVASLLGLGALGLGWALLLRSAPAKQVIRFSLNAPEGVAVQEPFWSHPAISPDGRWVAFIAYKGGTSGLWIRALDSITPQLLPGTEGALAPFWSPDSRMVAFFSEVKLKKIAPSGGAPQTICDVPSHVACGSWNKNGTIVFAALEAPEKNGLYRVSATGAAVKLQIPKAENVPLHVFFPYFLPDGNQFLFLGIADMAVERFLYLGTLQDSSEELRVRLLGNMISRVEYDPSGYLLAVRDNTLVAQPFDAAKVTFLGEPIPFVENVQNFGGGAASFSISHTGVLLYQLETPAPSQIEWFDRTGRSLGSVGTPSQYRDIRLSPDGERVAAAIAEPSTGEGDIWILSFPQGNATRLTSESSDDFGPIWSPDGREVAFASSRDGVPHLFRQGLGESDAQMIVPMNGHVQEACDWIPDCLLYTDRDPSTAWDIWAVPIRQNAEPVSIVRSRFKEIQADVSPNGRWIAYASNESGQYEIYIQAFSPSGVKGEKRRISSSGGLAPRWRGNGKEIFYIDLAAEPSLMAVALDAESGEPAGASQRLFQLKTQVQAFEVTTDGQRFLVNHVAGASSVPVMNFVVNWPEVVRQAQDSD